MNIYELVGPPKPQHTRIEIYFMDGDDDDHDDFYHFILTNESMGGDIDDVYWCETLEGSEFSARECLAREIEIEQGLGGTFTIVDSTGRVAIPTR